MSRKNIYISVIVICLIATAGIIYYGFGSSSKSPAPTVVTQLTTGSDSPTSGSNSSASRQNTSFGAPPVFPADNKFDWSLLESPTFKGLVAIPDLTLDPSQVGRPNPFK